MNLLDILTPLYLLIGFGFILHRYQFPSKVFWKDFERMIYYVLFPTLIFVALVKAPVDMSLLGLVALVILVPALLSGLIQTLGFLSTDISGPTFSSMFQGSVRNNTPISLVIAAWLLPEKGLAIMAVVILIMVPANNMTAIMVLLRYGKTEQVTVKNNGVSFLKNPLIIACIVGLLFNLLSIKLPNALLETADFLGRSALPFALLSVGAGLKLDNIFEKKLAIILSSVAKLIIAPLLSWSLCVMFNVEADLAKIAIIFSAIPTAVSSYILAKQMGGDADGMAQIITFQTLMAMVTIPVFLYIVQQY